MKSRYQLSYYMRILINVIVYVIFFAYIIYMLVTAKTRDSFIFNLIIGVGVGGIGLLYEYLRICYDAATKRLIVDNKPEKTLDLLSRVEKADIFKAFKTSCQMMRMLALTDLRRFDELKDYIKKLDEEDNYDYDTKLISLYSKMIAYGETGSKGKSNEAFKQLIELRDTKTSKGRRNKGAYYLNWEVVNGQHKNYENDYDGAFRYLKDIDESNLNRREVMHYLLAKTIASKNSGQSKIYDETRQRLLKVAENNKTMTDYIETI